MKIFSFSKRDILFFLVLFFYGICNADGLDICTVTGWASQNGGTTGGGNASSQTVSNYVDLKAKLTSTTVNVIYVDGTITIPAGGRITINGVNGKTIVGLSGARLVSSDLSSSGSGILYIKNSTNLIIRNLIFEGPGAYDQDGYDNLCLDNCQNVWIDHCEFHDAMDGNLDIKNMTNYVSITWCKFSYEKAPIPGGSGGADDHRFCNLIGASDSATDDDQKLCITFQYCWWADGCVERMPRIRYGKLHIVNNLFSSSVSNHCIRAGYKANVLAEGNYFDKQKLPIDLYNGDYTAVKGINNYGSSDISKGTAFAPPYSLAVSAPADIVTPIKSCAGATLTSTNGCSSCAGTPNMLPVVNLTAPVNNASYSASATISLSASVTDADGTIVSVAFYAGTTLLYTDNTLPYTYSWINNIADNYTITAKATDDKGGVSASSPIMITVINPNEPFLAATDTQQIISPASAIKSIVFSWSGAATDVTYGTLPNGLSAVKNMSSKTLTISGTPTASGSFVVTTIGGTGSKSITGKVIISKNTILANWYPFQENPISLPFISTIDATLNTTFDASLYAATGSTNGAVVLSKGTGAISLSFASLSSLKIRWGATGGRTLQIIYGPTGTETVWDSPVQYSSGGYEQDLTTMIPGLVSSLPIKITIINNRTTGGNLYITDLYAEGTLLQTLSQSIFLKAGWNLISTNLISADSSITQLFKGFDVVEIKTNDAFWNKNQNQNFNSLTTISPGKGYFVKLNTTGILTITGIAAMVAPNNPFPYVKPGWNLIGCPYQSSQPLSDIFNSSNSVEVKNIEGFWIPGGILNSISHLEPGKGYFLKAK